MGPTNKPWLSSTIAGRAAALASLVAMLALGSCSGPPARFAAASPTVEEAPEESIGLLIEAHNKARAEKKLPSLTVNPRLEEAARRHAFDMAEHRKMEHKGSDGSTPVERVEAAGYRYRRTAENIAYGQKTTDQVMKVWLNSPVHRHNILGAFSQIGAARATAKDGRIYWCVEFGLPQRR